MPRKINWLVLAALGWLGASVGQLCAQGTLLPESAKTLAPLTSLPGVESSPTLLAVPAPSSAPMPSSKGCRTCTNDYQSSYNYIPERNPDWRTKAPGVEPTACERIWGNAAYFIGLTEDMGDLSRDPSHGLRVGLGGWFDDSKTVGLDLSFLYTHDSVTELRGTTTFDAPLFLWTIDANVRSHLLTYGRFRVDGLAGYRYYSLIEELAVIGATRVDWKATNHVHLGQLGLFGNYYFGPYFGELFAKVGFGQNYMTQQVGGVTTASTSFATVTEGGVRMGYQIGVGLRTTIGYSLLYLDQAIRPQFREPASFFMQYLSFGLEAKF